MNAGVLLIVAILVAAILGVNVAAALPALIAATVVAAGLCWAVGAKDAAVKLGLLALTLAVLAAFWDRLALGIQQSLLEALAGPATGPLPSLLPPAAAVPPAPSPSSGSLWPTVLLVTLLLALGIVGARLAAHYLARRGHESRPTRPQARRRASISEPARSPRRTPQEIERDLDPTTLDDELDIF